MVECYVLCNVMYTEVSEDLLLIEREIDHFLTLTGVPGIPSPIGSLFQKCRRLCYPRIKQRIAVIVTHTHTHFLSLSLSEKLLDC